MGCSSFHSSALLESSSAKGSSSADVGQVFLMIPIAKPREDRIREEHDAFQTNSTSSDDYQLIQGFLFFIDTQAKSWHGEALLVIRWGRIAAASRSSPQRKFEYEDPTTLRICHACRVAAAFLSIRSLFHIIKVKGWWKTVA